MTSNTELRNALIGFGLFALILIMGTAGWIFWNQRQTGRLALANDPPTVTLTRQPTTVVPPTPTATLRPEGVTTLVIQLSDMTRTAAAQISMTRAVTLSLTIPPTVTPTQTPTPTLTFTPSSTPQFTPTPTPTLTPTLLPGSLAGRVVLDATPVGSGIKVVLQDTALNQIAETNTGTDGRYEFTGVTPATLRYQIVFRQEDNPSLSKTDIVNWIWLGEIQVESGTGLELPDLEVSIFGFKQTAPASGAVVQAATVSPANPLVFDWGAYPGASSYWIDLAEADQPELVWHERQISSTSFGFDGIIEDGTTIQPGDYQWYVGALAPAGNFSLTVYGQLADLTIVP